MLKNKIIKIASALLCSLLSIQIYAGDYFSDQEDMKEMKLGKDAQEQDNVGSGRLKPVPEDLSACDCFSYIVKPQEIILFRKDRSRAEIGPFWFQPIPNELAIDAWFSNVKNQAFEQIKKLDPALTESIRTAWQQADWDYRRSLRARDRDEYRAAIRLVRENLQSTREAVKYKWFSMHAKNRRLYKIVNETNLLLEAVIQRCTQKRIRSL